jgi:hypothetical protein
MAVRVPSNLIITSKYTIGNEFLLESDHTNYQGYYYELNGGTFAGKVFDTNAPTLISVTSSAVNDLLINPQTSTYGSVSGANVNVTNFNSTVYIGTGLRYFAKRIDSSPILIKEVNVDTYTKLQSDPFYQTIAVNIPSTDSGADSPALDQADQQMPGLKAFVNFS